jgi:hypothetical protein
MKMMNTWLDSDINERERILKEWILIYCRSTYEEECRSYDKTRCFPDIFLSIW